MEFGQLPKMFHSQMIGYCNGLRYLDELNEVEVLYEAARHGTENCHSNIKLQFHTASMPG